MFIKILNNDEKFQYRTKVSPNVIFNRFDIIYKGNFECLYFKHDDKEYYIQFHINNNICELGIYLIDLNKEIIEKIFKFINSNYKNVYYFYLYQTLVPFNHKFTHIDWVLNLPNSFEDYLKTFSNKSRYNKKRSRKILEKDFNVEYKYYNNETIPEEVYNAFCKYKVDKMENRSIVFENFDIFKSLITDIYTLYIDNEPVAIILYSFLEGKDCYCYNMAYNDKYKKYTIGNILFYYSIEKLIERNITQIYLGSGNYDYKVQSKANCLKTFRGFVKYKVPFYKQIFSYFIKDNRIYFNILGKLISHRFKDEINSIHY